MDNADLTGRLFDILGAPEGEEHSREFAPESPQQTAAAPQSGRASEDTTQDGGEGDADRPESAADWFNLMAAESGLEVSEGEAPPASAASEQALGKDAGKLTEEQWNSLPPAVQDALKQAVQDRQWRQDFNKSLTVRQLTSRHDEQRQQYDRWIAEQKKLKRSEANNQVDPLDWYDAEVQKLEDRRVAWHRAFDVSANRALAKLDEVDQQPLMLQRFAQEHGLEQMDIEELAKVHPDDWPEEAAKLGRYRAEINKYKTTTRSEAAENLGQKYVKEHMVKPGGTGRPKPPTYEATGDDSELDGIIAFSRAARLQRHS